MRKTAVRCGTCNEIYCGSNTLIWDFPGFIILKSDEMKLKNDPIILQYPNHKSSIKNEE